MHCPPPPRLTPPSSVQAAVIASMPKFAIHKKYTGKRLKGVQYEAKVQDYLSLLDANYIPGFWINFLSEGLWRYCQPDGIHLDIEKGIITIVEVKYQHTSDAWWQTKKLYLPVLEKLFPASLWRFQFCEVVKWFDVSTKFPEEIKLVSNPFQDSDIFKVHIWRP